LNVRIHTGSRMASRVAVARLAALRRIASPALSSKRAIDTSFHSRYSLQGLAEQNWHVQASGAVFIPRIATFATSAGGDETVATKKQSDEDDDGKRSLFNRILYRSRQRGYLELDLLLGKWAEDNIAHLDQNRLKDLVDLLEEENPDLWNWLTGQAEVPPELATNTVFTAIRDQISVNLTTFSSPNTRATPGQPWVRGWDDNRKVGGPQAGNQ